MTKHLTTLAAAITAIALPCYADQPDPDIEEKTEDSEMVEALEVMGLDKDMSKWVAGVMHDDHTKQRVNKAWNNLKLYGKHEKRLRDM